MTESIAERLEALRDANRLAQSLFSARGPGISRSMFEARSLGVVGLADGACALPDRALALVIAAAGRRHEVGSEYDVIVSPDDAVPARAVLLSVVQDPPVDALARGASATCIVQFPEGFPAPIRALRGSAHGVQLWLARRWDLDRLAR